MQKSNKGKSNKGGHTPARSGFAVLAAVLMATVGFNAPALATEPAPVAPPPSTAAPAPGSTAAVPAEAPTATATATPADATPAPSPEPTAAQPAATDPRSAMAAAVEPGGAEMGQRSKRVAGAAPAADGTMGTEALATEGTWTPTFGVQGLDVSGHQPNVDWQQQWNMGARFGYIKASEGNYLTNAYFGSQYEGSRSVGMIRGAY